MSRPIDPAREATRIASILAVHFDGDLRAQQTISLAEECGEFVGAARRYLGMARRTGTLDDVKSELADVIITAYVTAEVFGFHLDTAVEEKLSVIHSRPWKDPR